MLVNVEFGSRQLSNIVTALDVFAHQYEGLKSLGNILGSNWEIPEFTEEDIKSLFEAKHILGDYCKKAEEEEAKPKYDHRYAVRDNYGEPIQEYDTLKEAWDVYAEYYENDYNKYMTVDDGDYDIYDNKLERVVTRDVPYFEVEYSWNIDLELRLDGRSVDASDAPSSVMESIANCFSCGDEDGYVTDEVGEVNWEDIADWEEENEEDEEEPEPVRENFDLK